MAEERVERRLAAILAADVAGYSRLMGADEEGTLGALKAHRRELIDPKIAEHRGRIVKTTGDGMLVEFASVLDAVRCAVEMQRGIAERTRDVAAEKRIEFRVGINIGDIIIDGGDIFGDGVNVAARLEALAEPGGICISGTVHEHVAGRLDFAYADLGEQSVKNIARPVRVYRVEAKAAPEAPKPAAPSLSILVLPFANMGGDVAQDFLADVLTEEITTYLSRIPDSFVIARSTAFTFKGKPIDVKRIGAELGVRYVLEGSAQPSGSRVRVNAQLIDTATGAHLWAEKFDAARGDLLDMQDEIVTRIARTLHIQLSTIDAARLERVHLENPDAEALAMRTEALFLVHGISTREETKAYVRLCEEALQRDPHNVRALAILGLTRAVYAEYKFSSSIEDDTRSADELITHALALAPNHYLAHHAKAALLMIRHRHLEAIVEDERALELNPAYIGTYMTLGRCHAILGKHEEGLLHLDKAIRLSPRDPFLWAIYGHKGMLHLMAGQDDLAIDALSRSVALNPANSTPRGYLAAALALGGRVDEAHEHLARFFAAGMTKTIADWKVREDSTNPVYSAFCERLYEGLRKAGMPEV